MALPSSKYSQPKHTPGKEFTLDGKNYRGWYVTTYQDKHYTGKTLDSKSKRLHSVDTTAPSTDLIFIEQPTEPSAADRTSGIWTRYFIQKLANKKIIEVTRNRYNKFKGVAGYVRGELNWKIKGPADNQTVNGYVYFGAAHVNEVNTSALNTALPGISNYIKDYSKFVE